MAMASTSWGLLRLLKIALQGFSMPFRASFASTMVSNSTSTSLVPRTYSRFFLACTSTLDLPNLSKLSLCMLGWGHKPGSVGESDQRRTNGWMHSLRFWEMWTRSYNCLQVWGIWVKSWHLCYRWSAPAVLLLVVMWLVSLIVEVLNDPLPTNSTWV